MIEKILKSLRDELGEDYQIEHVKVPKNNGIKVDAIRIRQGTSSIGSVIHINECLNDGLSVDEIKEEVIYVYNKAMENIENKTFSIEEMFSKEDILNNITYRIMNKKNNEKILSDKPYEELLDLALGYNYKTHINGREGVIFIDNNFMKSFNISKEELKAAVNSVKNKQNFIMMSMIDYMVELLPKNEAQTLKKNAPSLLDDKCYIVSTEDKYQGATILAYPEILGAIASKFDTDLIIAPSSVDEVIVFVDVPKENTQDFIQGLCSMVKGINGDKNMMRPTDVLADTVYKFSLKDNKLEIAATISELDLSENEEENDIDR